MSLGGEKEQSGRFGENKNFLILPRINPLVVQLLAWSQDDLSCRTHKEYRKCYCDTMLGFCLVARDSMILTLVFEG
jgi:hypothetical protein